jgi:hypothetical protein
MCGTYSSVGGVKSLILYAVGVPLNFPLSGTPCGTSSVPVFHPPRNMSLIRYKTGGVFRVFRDGGTGGVSGGVGIAESAP